MASGAADLESVSAGNGLGTQCAQCREGAQWLIEAHFAAGAAPCAAGT
ncbi:MAG: hypothetical protein ACK5TK_16650 [Betaproteobacteria bacterium]